MSLFLLLLLVLAIASQCGTFGERPSSAPCLRSR